MNSYRRGLRNGVLVNPKLFILEKVNLAPPTNGWSNLVKHIKNLYYLVRVVTVCVDFRDLNKASLKDDFPIPHIDMLVDSTAGHSMLSFMGGFSEYNHIMIAPENMEKTSFITEWGTYFYRFMPFRLNNAGATYQRAATTLFHDMMHRDVKVYVDDMIVKSRDRADDLVAL